MSFADQILIYTFTSLSILITLKSVKTAVVEIIWFVNWLISKIRTMIYLIYPNRKPVESTSSLGRLFATSKSTLMPFIDRNYYQKIKRQRLLGLGYLLIFIFGIFLIITFFWAFLTADLNAVLADSPYLIGSIQNLLIRYQTISKMLSVLFILGFFVEVMNSIRSFFGSA